MMVTSMFYNEYINGYIQRGVGGRYDGSISVDGIELSPIEATFFDNDGKQYLWLKRKSIKEYDWERSEFRTRQPKPQWESYLEKQVDNDVVAYKGQFAFMRFRYEITAVWDTVLGKEKSRLNLFVDRLPMSQQTILTTINERKRNGQ